MLRKRSQARAAQLRSLPAIMTLLNTSYVKNMTGLTHRESKLHAIAGLYKCIANDVQQQEAWLDSWPRFRGRPHLVRHCFSPDESFKPEQPQCRSEPCRNRT